MAGLSTNLGIMLREVTVELVDAHQGASHERRPAVRHATRAAPATTLLLE
jgi:hypothetical protein